LGPAYAIFKLLIKELIVFAMWFFLYQFVFAVIGNLLFFDIFEYNTLTESLLTIFKASAGVFNGDQLVTDTQKHGYAFLLIYMIICFVLF
jgi:hypothetical protein